MKDGWRDRGRQPGSRRKIGRKIILLIQTYFNLRSFLGSHCQLCFTCVSMRNIFIALKDYNKNLCNIRVDLQLIHIQSLSHIITRIQSHTAINAFYYTWGGNCKAPIQQNILQYPLPSDYKKKSSIYGCVRNDPCLVLPCKRYHLPTWHRDFA